MFNASQLRSGLTLCLCFVGSLSHAIADESANPELARVAAEGYLNNRESISFFKCRFTVVIGTAEGVEEAKNGKIAPTVAAKGLWFYNSPSFRYELKCNPDDIKQIISKSASTSGTIGIPLLSEGYLSDGEHGVVYDPITGSANVIRPSDKKVGAPGLTPFGMGIMGENESRNPGTAIRQWLGRGGFVNGRYVLGEHGERLIRVEIGHSADRVLGTYIIAPERGYLLVEFAEYDASGKPVVQMFLTEALKLRDGHWFPGRSVVVTGAKDASKGLYVREIVTDSLEDEAPPSDEDMIFALDEGTRINYLSEKGKSRAELKKTVSLSPDEIADLPEKAETLVGQVEDHRRSRATVALAASIPLVLLCIWLLWKRRCDIDVP